ncbi:MAG: polysaccharide deacetylase family protein [Candidatus Thiodiazotropha sp.]
MKLKNGIFTVSLDFELYWGVRDKRSIEQYKGNLHGVREAVPEILAVFSQNNIHATWATVGFLFFKNVQDLYGNIPKTLPTYDRQDLSPYEDIKNVRELDPKFHFAPDLIEVIRQQSGQEIGTHTFSHYYCLEEGQTLEQFENDILAAIEIAKSKNISIKSLVFPRNQWNSEYLSLLLKLGVQCYRGNEPCWIYKASNDEEQSKIQRALRLLDAYFNLSGHNTYDLAACIQKKPFNFRASRFLRPYSSKLSFLDKLRLKRIKDAMSFAATNNKIFHLWWHPHNFGVNTKENIEFLTKIVEHYNELNIKHGMKSLNMGEMCHMAGAENG